ncbi:MAG: PINc/VapC family ATPase [Candidatus Thermoplasmatota archaeon]
MAETLVPDTSVLVDGRITELVKGGQFAGAKVLVPLAALSELEAQANRGLETGFAGLDELAALQKLAATGAIAVQFVGERPSADEIERAKSGTIDARIRDAAVAAKAIYVTSDRVSAHAAAAQGIRHHYVRPIVQATPDLTGLKLWQFFDAQTMSVHLKADCVPMVKRGRPGEVAYQPHGPASKEMAHTELRAIVRECIEHCKRDYNSFIEMEKHGCTVLQVGPMRITIAQPPFSDGLELTAVRPITKKHIADYELNEDILGRLEGHARGLFIAGPPGSGKSTFAAAVAEHLHSLARVVKTMEQPRDLQVPKEVTQYGALDRDMKWTGDVILLVRPDHVLYDEVRTTEDFRTFGDMRLAGVGLIGVTHANRAIDAVQRLIGRIDLGMIPQVVDTVLFIDAGRIAQILELEYTVKVPDGMVMEDLARPVVVVRDVLAGQPVYELYTYGEQVVVMPLNQTQATRDPASQLAEKELERMLRRTVQGPMEVTVRGGKAIVKVDESEVPQLIGKGGRTVQGLERKLGIRLDIKALTGPPRGRDDDRHQGGWDGKRPASAGMRGAAGVPRIRVKRASTNIFLLVDGAKSGQVYQVEAEGAIIGEATASNQGRLRFKLDTPEGMALDQADKRGLVLSVQVA